MARYYQTSYVQPKSAYVPLPFEAMAAKLQTMQQAQDQYRQTIEGFDKPIINLAVDDQRAIEIKEDVQNRLQTLRELDFNDSANRDAIYKGIREIRDIYSPQGGVGLLEQRYNTYNANKKHIQEVYKNNPTQMGFLLQQLDDQFYYQNETGERDLDRQNKSLQKDPVTGKWYDPGISSPKEWTWVEEQKWASDALKDIEYDQRYDNYGFTTPTGFQSAIKAFKEGNTQHKDYQKIAKALADRAQGDVNLQMSAQAKGSYFDLGDQSNWYNTDKNGNIIFNEKTILGSTLRGAARGNAFERKTVDTKFVKDDLADARARDLDEEKKNAFTTTGQIPGTTSIVDAEKNSLNILTLKQQRATINPNTVEGKAQLEKLDKQIAIAEAYQNQILIAAKPTEGYQQGVNNDWEKINKYRTDPSSRSGFVNDPLMIFMNSKEANEKIKTKEDYDNWIQGKIQIGTTTYGGIRGIPQTTKVLSEEELRVSTRTDILSGVQELKDGKLNITYTANTISGTGVDKVNEKLTEFVNTVPTGFITQDGSDYQQWKADTEQRLKNNGTLEKAKVSISITDQEEGGYVVTYTSPTGALLASTVIQPNDPSVAVNAANVVGNNLVNVYQDNKTSAGQANLKLGQSLVATSGSQISASAKTKDLVNYTNNIPDPTTPGTSNTFTYTDANGNTRNGTPPQTVMLSDGKTMQVSYNIVKSIDNNGNRVTKYQPTDVNGNKIFDGSEGYPGLNFDGSFNEISLMQIALAKEDINITRKPNEQIGPNDVLKEDSFKVK